MIFLFYQHVFCFHFLFRRFEVIDRLDSANDLGGRSDIFHDLRHALIRHGGLVKRIRYNAGGIDPRHFRLVFRHGQPFKGGGTGHQTACAVGRGAVPILVSLADTNERAVTHIDGNEQLLARFGGYRSFAEDSFVHIYIVVNRGIGGDTTFDLEKRLKVSVYDLKPKVAVMLIGANNVSTMFENYEKILIGLKENLPQTKIVLLSLTSMGGDHWGKNNQLSAFNNVKIKMLAEKYGFEFVDLYSPLLNIEDNEIYDEYTTDGGHLTPKGYEVVTAQVMPILESLLN